MQPQSESLEAVFVDGKMTVRDPTQVFSKQNLLTNDISIPFAYDLEIEEITVSFVAITFYLLLPHQSFLHLKGSLKEV